MSEQNKHNLLYFESTTMKGLYENMKEWQQINSKRLLSTTIQKDDGKFCCIALTNPTEVVICDGDGDDQATVFDGRLEVSTKYQ